MDHFGLTDEEKKTNLHQYNHALFKNSRSFMDLNWEINMLYGTVVIMEDNAEPELTFSEHSYEALFREYLARRVPPEDHAVFQSHMAPDKLEGMTEEVSFHLHLRAGDGPYRLYRIVLTPAFDATGLLYCVYLGGLCLHDGGITAASPLRSFPFREALLHDCYFHFAFDVTAGGLIWGDFAAKDGSHPIREATGLVDPCPYDLWVQKWYELYQPQFDKEQESNIFNVEFFKRSFQQGERFLDVEVKQKRPAGGQEFMHIFVVLMADPADDHIHACIIWREIDLFRSSIIEKRLSMRTDNEALQRTVSRDDQFRRAALSGALMVYNINLTKNLIEDEFYEIVDGKSYPMLQLVGLTAPCSFDTFCARWKDAKVPNESKATFTKLYNRQYLLDAYARGEYQLEFEFETIIGRGIPVTLRNTILLVKDPESGELLAMVNGKDVTAQRQAEVAKRHALQAAYDAANRANAAKSDFLARMSHDIRTPMNAIIGMTAIAAAHLDDKARVSDCLDKITVSSKHLLGLINEVLDMSKIESGKIDLLEEDLVLPKLVEDLLVMCRPQIKAKGHTLNVNVHGIVHERVIGDSQHLRQAFMNLMSNAIKYTPPGGRIGLSVTEKPTIRPNIGCYEFIIEDNGIGMSEDFLRHLYDPFERAEDSRVQHEQGTGLGMPITRNIVQMMNGKIDVESAPDQGTKFTVTIFLKLREGGDSFTPVKRGALERLQTSDFSGRRALLVEDNALNAEIAMEFLGMMGFAVDWVENGRLALETMERAADGAYDIVFMDIQMPEMNGLEAARAIRALGREYTRTVPILAMSANAFAEDVEESKAAGMNDHVAKPLDLDRLPEVLTRLLH